MSDQPPSAKPTDGSEKPVASTEVLVYAEDSPELRESETVRELSAAKPEIGFGLSVPAYLLKAHEFSISIPQNKPTDLVVNRRMIVTDMSEAARKQQLDFGDWITHVEGELIRSHRQYLKTMDRVRKKTVTNCKDGRDGECTHLHAVQVRFKVRRTIKCIRIAQPKSSKFIPPGYDLMPGFCYLHAYLVMYPGASLGLKIKGYEGKIYVSHTDNGWKSLAVRSLLVGDVIVTAEEQVAESVKQTSQVLLLGLQTKRIVSFRSLPTRQFVLRFSVHLVVERPETPVGVQRVRIALATERKLEMNPRMADDVVELCERQVALFRSNPDQEPLPSIYVQPAAMGGAALDEAKSGMSGYKPPRSPIASSPIVGPKRQQSEMHQSVRASSQRKLRGTHRKSDDEMRSTTKRKERRAAHVRWNEQPDHVPIGMDAVNPLLLQKVQKPEEQSRRMQKRRKHRKRSAQAVEHATPAPPDNFRPTADQSSSRSVVSDASSMQQQQKADVGPFEFESPQPDRPSERTKREKTTREKVIGKLTKFLKKQREE